MRHDFSLARGESSQAEFAERDLRSSPLHLLLLTIRETLFMGGDEEKNFNFALFISAAPLLTDRCGTR